MDHITPIVLIISKTRHYYAITSASNAAGISTKVALGASYWFITFSSLSFLVVVFDVHLQDDGSSVFYSTTILVVVFNDPLQGQI